MNDFALFAISLTISYAFLSLFSFPPSMGMAALIAVGLFVVGKVVLSSSKESK